MDRHMHPIEQPQISLLVKQRSICLQGPRQQYYPASHKGCAPHPPRAQHAGKAPDHWGCCNSEGQRRAHYHPSEATNTTWGLCPLVNRLTSYQPITWLILILIELPLHREKLRTASAKKRSSYSDVTVKQL